MGNENETLSKLQIVADDIAEILGVRIDRFEMEDGLWIVSLETDEGAVKVKWQQVGEGQTLHTGVRIQGWALEEGVDETPEHHSLLVHGPNLGLARHLATGTAGGSLGRLLELGSSVPCVKAG